MYPSNPKIVALETFGCYSEVIYFIKSQINLDLKVVAVIDRESLFKFRCTECIGDLGLTLVKVASLLTTLT
jgi:hypothetical protein